MMSVADLARESWSRYLAGIKQYTLLALIFVVPSLAVLLVWGTGAKLGGGFVGGVANFIFGSLAAVCLAYAMEDGGASGWRVYLEKARGVFLNYLGLQLLRGVIELVGFILFIVPGIIFMVWFALADLAIVFERISPVEALRWSKAHVKGRFVPMLTRIIAALFMTLPFFALSFVINIFLPGPTGAVVAQHIMLLFLVPWLMSYLYSVYQDFKRTRELAVETTS